MMAPDINRCQTSARFVKAFTFVPTAVSNKKQLEDLCVIDKNCLRQRGVFYYFAQIISGPLTCRSVAAEINRY